MKFNIVTLFPEMIQQGSSFGILGQAISKNLLELKTYNPRDYTEDKHRQVDDRPFGGGDGMLMLAEPLSKTLKAISGSPNSFQNKVIYLSPQGKVADAEKIKSLAKEEELTFICGRYGGIDQRFLNEYVTEELSIGDYVLSGGELAALVLIDAVSRWIPGVLGHEDSATADSFSDGLLESPTFTRPQLWREQEVPAVFRSGNHAEIEKSRKFLGCLMTLQKRPEVLKRWLTLKTENKKTLSDSVKFMKSLALDELKSLGLNEELILENLKEV